MQLTNDLGEVQRNERVHAHRKRIAQLALHLEHEPCGAQHVAGGIAQHKADAGNHRLALALFDEQTADEGQQQVAHQIAAGGACQLGNARAVAGEHRHAHKADEKVHRHAQGAELGPQQPCGQADDKV